MSWTDFLWIPVAGYLLVLAFFYVFQERLVFFPHAGSQTTPQDWGLSHQEFFVASGGHRLHGWFIPGKADQPVILYSHGNASTISQLRDYALLFHRLGLGVLFYDYRGYGRSEGTPDEPGVYEDGEAVWQWLVVQQGIAPARIVQYGHSLGGGIATWLAERHPGLALVVEGTFTSIPELGQIMYPFLPAWLARLSFDNKSRVGRMRVPVLVIHARADEIVPFAHGQQLFEAAQSPKEMLETFGDHNRGFVADAASWAIFQNFLQKAAAFQSTSQGPSRHD